ncbi:MULTISPECIES: hypothetical protein [Candidatus Ichthyocystis]|uniref:Putative membrane protein n=1 Tax=Candidatus Ichthyocystis hellenicum TaxID=1561003 RepID=A0A0S4M0Q1_9BURK|nr:MULTISPECIES: hypothetical protein [Ichthyocystis]CUT17397.1 putative membrane protein [Candidatus Ichthyocystis hellenicum]
MMNSSDFITVDLETSDVIVAETNASQLSELTHCESESAIGACTPPADNSVPGTPKREEERTADTASLQEERPVNEVARHVDQVNLDIARNRWIRDECSHSINRWHKVSFSIIMSLVAAEVIFMSISCARLGTAPTRMCRKFFLGGILVLVALLFVVHTFLYCLKKVIFRKYPIEPNRREPNQ